MNARTYMTLLALCFGAMYTQAQEAKSLPDVLTLSEARRIALSDSPTLKAAQARVEQAEAVVKQSKSEFLPSLKATAGASFTDVSDAEVKRGEAIALLSGASFDDTVESYTGNVTMSYLVFDGFGRKFRNAHAQYGADRSEASLREAHRLLLNVVSLAYHNAQLARENITIAHADEAFNQRQLKEAKLRYKAGHGSLSDTLNFEVRIRAAQSALLQAERSESVSLIALVQLMGVTHSRVPEGLSVDGLVVEREGEMVLPKTDALIDQALEDRPDLRDTRLLLNQTEALVGMSKSNYYPTVSGFLSGDAYRGDNGYFEGDDVSSTIGVQLQYNIFSGGRRKALLNENRAINREVNYVLSNQEIQVVADVQESVRNLETAQQVLILQRETTSLVEQNRDLVEKEYRAGQGSLVRLNQAQRDLTSQQASLARARVSLRQAWVNLNSATGADVVDLSLGSDSGDDKL